MKKINMAVETAKQALDAARDQKFSAEALAKADNTRHNRKLAQVARLHYARKVEHYAHLKGEQAAQQMGKEYSYPHKLDNKQSSPKAGKIKVRKEKRIVIAAAKPKTVVVADQEWAAKKEEDKARKAIRPIVGQTKNEPVVCGQMEDTYRGQMLTAAWEAAEAGCEAAYEVLQDLLPVNSEEAGLQKVDPDAFYSERAKVRHFEDAIKAMPIEFARLSKNLDKAEDHLAMVTKRVRIAKMMATKARNAYLAAAESEKPDRYARMIERNRHLNVVLRQQTVAQQKVAFKTTIVFEYADHWDEREADLRAKLERAQAKLELTKKAYRHEKRQAVLDEVFAQRYERAEWVPEKEDAHRYKVYNVSPRALYGVSLLRLLDEMEKLATEKPEGWLAKGRAIFAQFALALGKIDTFSVDAKNCCVNNVAGSLLSDIMGVRYGKNDPCKEMVLVNYDLAGTFKIYWEFLGEDYQAANSRAHAMRTYIMNKLVRNGVLLTGFDGKTIHYDLLASNNSQQKKGQAYMGETETMKVTEKLREYGWLMDDAIAHRTDNAVEWLKRNATMTTPAAIIKDKDGNVVPASKILMMGDVDIERLVNNVTTVNGAKLERSAQKKLKMTMFDGQALWLKPGRPTTQGRGAGLKFMAIAKPDYELPEYAYDIMGNKVRIADYDILMTKSCWKANKMGLSWYQFRDTVTELAELCPGYDLLRAVRYSDREIGDEENPRNLARQATQQWIGITDETCDKLTRKSRRWLKNQKKYREILAMLGEWSKPESERSSLAKLFNRFPQLVLHPAIRQYLETRWMKKRNTVLSGRIRTEGMYPYICQDPIAMIQILLEGRDPNADDLGVLKGDEVNLPKVKEGRKVYCIRYPANYLVGMVVKQKNVAAFSELGNVAVLSYYGTVILQADGDFDGDEMLFLFDDLIIETMEDIIRRFNPGPIDFPHGKIACDKPFGDKENFISEVSNALVRAQEYNQVGLYSNLAVICLQQASVAKDAKTCQKWLNAAIFAHVGAILCLDLVKGAEVPKELLNTLEQLNRKVRKVHKMPWNQQFSHPEAEVEERSTSTQDRLVGVIFDDVGEFEIEFEEGETMDFTFESIVPLMNMGVDTTNATKVVLGEDAIKHLHGLRFEDAQDQKLISDADAGIAIGFADWLRFGWHNSASILWKMSGADMAEKRNELEWFIREQVMASIRSGIQSEYPIDVRYASVVKNIVGRALGFWVDKNGELVTWTDKDGNTTVEHWAVDENKIGSYAMFVLRVFAKDILAVAEAGGVTPELAVEMTAPRPVEENDVPDFTDVEYQDEYLPEPDDGEGVNLAEIMDESWSFGYEEFPA